MVRILEALIDLICRAIGIPTLFGDEMKSKRRSYLRKPDFSFLDDKKN